MPPAAGSRVAVDAASARVVHETSHVRAFDGDGSLYGEHDATPGTWVVFEREGWQRLHVRAPPSGTRDVAWGPFALHVNVSDEDGPVDALVLVGDQVHAAPEGRLELRGLDTGLLRVVVARRDVVGEGRAFTLRLEAGETRELDVTLPFD